MSDQTQSGYEAPSVDQVDTEDLPAVLAAGDSTDN